MLKAQAQTQENISAFKPLHLLQPNIQGRQIFIFCTNSGHSFWMKENQSAWEEVMINPDGYSCDRDGGSATFKFTGKEFKQLYISSPLGKETSCISGDHQHIDLKKLPLSKEKLDEIGITNQVLKLDLSEIPQTKVDAEKAQNEKLDKSKELPASRLANLFTSDMGRFFDKLSKDSKESEAGTSSASEKLAKQLSQLKM